MKMWQSGTPHFRRTRRMLLHGVIAGRVAEVTFVEKGTIGYWKALQGDGYDRTYSMKLSVGDITVCASAAVGFIISSW